MGEPDSGFRIDEAPLREWVLKAYHERRQPSGDGHLLQEAIRELLSGPIGGPCERSAYWFEKDPESTVPRFARSLDAVVKDLHRAVFDPLLAADGERAAEGRHEIAPSPGVFVASLAGPIALRSGIDETVVTALVATALIVLARLGRSRVETLVGSAQV